MGNGTPTVPFTDGWVRRSICVGEECTKNGFDFVKIDPESNLSWCMLSPDVYVMAKALKETLPRLVGEVWCVCVCVFAFGVRYVRAFEAFCTQEFCIRSQVHTQIYTVSQTDRRTK
jgi:hypothetical protein